MPPTPIEPPLSAASPAGLGVTPPDADIVASRTAELATDRRCGDAADIEAALESAHRVRGIDDPHLKPWRAPRATCPPATGATHTPPALTVLYDGACPLCRREIGVYRGLQPLQPDSPVCFADVSDATVPLPLGTTRAQLMARFHVQRHDGQLLSGAQAFLALWSALPGWRWLALAGRLPGVAWLMERMYRLFLLGRPALQRWATRLSRPD